MGLSQREFASLAGTTQARVSKIENGETDPRLSTLIELVRSLDLDLVLVPRRYLPAVNAIIAQTPHSPAEKTTRNTLGRLGNLARQLRERFPENKDTASLDRIARELLNYRLSGADLRRVTRAADALASIQATPALLNTLGVHTDELRRMRNELVHAAAKEEVEPRSAYRLDNEEEDDG